MIDTITAAEFQKLAKGKKKRKYPKFIEIKVDKKILLFAEPKDETELQIHCVEWFDNQFTGTYTRYYARLDKNGQQKLKKVGKKKKLMLDGFKWSALQASSNGIPTTPLAKSIMKKMGMVVGQNDLTFIIPNRKYIGLCLELKTVTGEQDEAQIVYQMLIEQIGYKYVIVRTLEQFQKVINDYLNNKL